MASSGGKRALPSPDVILLHATVKLEEAGSVTEMRLRQNLNSI